MSERLKELKRSLKLANHKLSSRESYIDFLNNKLETANIEVDEAIKAINDLEKQIEEEERK